MIVVLTQAYWNTDIHLDSVGVAVSWDGLVCWTCSQLSGNGWHSGMKEEKR